MKNITLSMLFVFGLFTGLFAQDNPKSATATFTTSAQCGMCKTKIETEMGLTKGVKSAKLDMDTNVLTIVYKPKKTSPEDLARALNKLGYDAGESIADEAAYKKLDSCCKKPEDR